MPFDLPAHSPLGASSAERWMNCPGSVSLVKSFVASASYVEDSPDWQQDGIEAHGVAAYCLTHDVDAWQMIGHTDYPRITPDMGMAVQVYLDYVRTVCGGESYVEYRLHRPNLHQLAYGTLDFACVQPGLVRIVDYKHGAGVYVAVRNNPQIMYYANLLLDELALPDDTAFELTIVQPNAYTPEGEDVIRTWETNAKALRDWLTTELVPSMDKTLTATAEFKQGEWCRFCPVKIVCPAMALMVEEAIRLNALPYEHVPLMKMLIKASETDEYNRLLDGQPSTGGKLVAKKVDRVWKADAHDVLIMRYGVDAMKPAALRSPSDVESLPGGKELVKEYAWKPDGGLVVAHVDDRRKEMRPVRASELHGAAVQKILDAARKAV